jgi:hypothetical protein
MRSSATSVNSRQQLVAKSEPANGLRSPKENAMPEKRMVGDPSNHRMKHTWYVTFEIPWRRTAVRRRRSRSTQTFATETEAKNFARAKFDEGLVVTAGTIIPHLPRRAIASGIISSWLEEGQEQSIGDAAESTDAQSGKIE